MTIRAGCIQYHSELGHIIHFNWFYCDALIACIFQRWMTKKPRISTLSFQTEFENRKIKAYKYLVFCRKKSYKVAKNHQRWCIENFVEWISISLVSMKIVQISLFFCGRAHMHTHSPYLLRPKSFLLQFSVGTHESREEKKTHTKNHCK